ncbi:MAG: helix-hairpin-helix domain-containing protein [Bacteroidales bacterium]
MKRLFRMTHGERIGLILILIIVGIIILLNKVSSETIHSEESFLCIDTSFQKEVEVYLASLDYNRYEKTNKIPQATESYVLFDFDPNKADSITLSELGLSAFVCSNIIKYRRKGGLFRTKASFGKIFGMDSVKFKNLCPHICIDSSLFIKKRVQKEYDTIPSFKFKEKQIVDLNLADTSLLKKIPGIGTGYAKMIVGYRNKLGGFYKVDQLNEIHNIPDSVKLKLKEWVVINSTDDVRKIIINKASVERLFNHPYINFYQAKAINEIKKKRGTIRHINELSLLEEFSASQLEQLAYYLDFEI